MQGLNHSAVSPLQSEPACGWASLWGGLWPLSLRGGREFADLGRQGFQEKPDDSVVNSYLELRRALAAFKEGITLGER